MKNTENACNKNNFRNFLRIMSFIKAGKAEYIIGLIGSSLVGAGASVLTALVVRDLLDAAILKDSTRLVHAVVFIIITAAGLCIFAPIFNYMFRRTIQKTMAGIRLAVMEHLEKMKIGYFETTHSGEIISLTNNDIQAVEATFADNFMNLASTVITGLCCAVMMFIIEWRTALILILLGGISAFLNSRFAAPIRRISDNIQQGYANLSERVSDLINGLNTIKVFNIHEQIKEKYDKENNYISEKFMKYIRIIAFQGSVNYLFAWLNFGGVILIGAIMSLYGTISFGSLIANIQLLNGVTFMFLQLGGFIAGMQSSMAGAVRVFELLDEPLEEEEKTHDVEQQLSIAASDSDNNAFIEISNLVFSYEEGKKTINDISMSLDKGCTAALAGPSGGGKSTLVKLLMGFYRPESGDVKIKGKSIRQYPLEELRDLVAYVPQDAYLFEGSIKENIRYGRPEADMEDVIEAAKTANAHEFIMSLTDGYNTLVGERGAKLSGGQRQRIAIARAVLKNAPLLLLDEATSSLDSESEQLVQDALEKLMKGKTVIAIAHRLSTIEHAHIIYVIDNGKVVESGNHTELSEEHGLYRQLYELQFM